MSNEKKGKVNPKKTRPNPRIVENMGDDDFIYIPPKKSNK